MQNLSWEIGDVTITRIVESDAMVAISDLIPAATPAAIAPHKPWLEPHFIDDDDNTFISFHSLVVESKEKIIVVDTCIGEHGDPFLPDRPIVTGFMDDFFSAGFPREAVDVVLCTHLHYDHVGWNTMRVNGSWVPTFPNARYLFSIQEYKYWQQESMEPVVTNFNDAVQAVFDAGLADLVEMNHRITDEVCLLPTPGHSPGHVSLLIESCDQRALITGDMTHHPVQWSEPDWSLPLADYDEAQGAKTRRRIISEHVNTGTLVIGTHYPTPTAGLLIDNGEGVQFKS